MQARLRAIQQALTLVALTLLIPQTLADDNGVKQPHLVAPAVQIRLAELREALASQDPARIANFLYFPLNLMGPTAQGPLKQRQIVDAKTFTAQFVEIMTPLQQQFLACLSPDQLQFDGFDYSGLAGQFWLRDFLKQGKRDFYISTLSQDAEMMQRWVAIHCEQSDDIVPFTVPTQVSAPVTSDPILSDRILSDPIPSAAVTTPDAKPETPAPSLRVFRGQSEQHRVEVMEIKAGQWRYRSWLKGQTTGKPALEITGARWVGQALEFRRGKYRYQFIHDFSQDAAMAQSELVIYYQQKQLRTEFLSRE